MGAGGSPDGASWRSRPGDGTPHYGVTREGIVLATGGHSRAAENRVASKGGGGDFNFEKDATRNRKQNHQEQKRQDQKARKAGKAERAAERGSAQYG